MAAEYNPVNTPMPEIGQPIARALPVYGLSRPLNYEGAQSAHPNKPHDKPHADNHFHEREPVHSLTFEELNAVRLHG